MFWIFPISLLLLRFDFIISFILVIMDFGYWGVPGTGCCLTIHHRREINISCSQKTTKTKDKTYSVSAVVMKQVEPSSLSPFPPCLTLVTDLRQFLNLTSVSSKAQMTQYTKTRSQHCPGLPLQSTDVSVFVL